MIEFHVHTLKRGGKGVVREETRLQVSIGSTGWNVIDRVPRSRRNDLCTRTEYR